MKDSAAEPRRFTHLSILVACFIDGAASQLLPSSFRALEANLGFTPAHLGSLALMQALFISIMAPFWGSLVDERIISHQGLLAVGAASWGLFTTASAMVSDFYVLLIIRAFTGAALASMMPVSQSVIASQAEAEERGKLFGIANAMQCMGQVTTVLLATSVSNLSVNLLGMDVAGWRFPFLLVGQLSISLAGLLSFSFEETLHPSNARGPRSWNLRHLVEDVGSRCSLYLRIPTFKVIIAQGLFGAIPWSATCFLPMLFQCVGFKDGEVTILTMIFMFAVGVGALLGGYIGDVAASQNGHAGRVLVSQISIASGIVFTSMLYCVIDANNRNFGQYAVLLCAIGLTASWTLPGCKRPLLTELVERHDWASFFALDVALEGSSGALFGAPVMGVLAARAYGYQTPSSQIHSLAPDIRQSNVRALASAIYIMILIPGIICLIIWSFTYLSYPKDLERVRSQRDLDLNDEQLSLQEEAQAAMNWGVKSYGSLSHHY